MRIINLDESNINNLINLYMSYCSELRIRKDEKIIKDYFDRAIKHVENNTLDFNVLILIASFLTSSLNSSILVTVS